VGSGRKERVITEEHFDYSAERAYQDNVTLREYGGKDGMLLSPWGRFGLEQGKSSLEKGEKKTGDRNSIKKKARDTRKAYWSEGDGTLAVLGERGKKEERRGEK